MTNTLSTPLSHYTRDQSDDSANPGPDQRPNSTANRTDAGAGYRARQNADTDFCAARHPLLGRGSAAFRILAALSLRFDRVGAFEIEWRAVAIGTLLSCGESHRSVYRRRHPSGNSVH